MLLLKNNNTNTLKQSLTNIFRIVVKPLHRRQREKLILPIAINLLGLQILTRKQLLSHVDKYSTLIFGFEEFIGSSQVNSIGKIPEGIKMVSAAFTIGKPFVSEIENAQLVSSTAVGFQKDGTIIAETTLPPTGDLSPRFDGAISIQSLLLNKLPGLATNQLDIACSLVNFRSKSYYHWFLDCLTRLEGLEYYKEHMGCKPILIIDSNPTSWQIESLKLLGYNSDDYIQWDQTKITVKKLVVSAFRQPGNWVSPAALHWLRQRLYSHLSTIENYQRSFSPRLYISRSQASSRRVTNEDEVMEVLRPLGFVSYILESMNLIDQIRLFSSAEIIIGSHGAGFTNIIFSQKKPTIIEFVNPWVSPHYYLISSILGFSYWCFECHQVYNKKFIKPRDNMRVDIASLKSLVEQVMK
ncbi:MAG: glycosyltransferase family 61 protein [Scytonema sp. PMC 1070.18]|nr:glycosyltransferase family 61 protein [Scytonema sp. PMC 1070.18]